MYVVAVRVDGEIIAPLLSCRVGLGSAVYTDGFRSYRVVERMGFKYFPISHSLRLYAVGPMHVSSCECYNWHLHSFLWSKWGMTIDRASFML